MKLCHTPLYIVLIGALQFSCAGKTDYLVTIETEYGTMKAILYDDTPEHKANFIRLARAGEYDSTTFYRIIEDFMIQGGDLKTRPDRPPEVDYTIPAEFDSRYFHKKGAIGAARRADRINPDKESSGSQFYIVDGKRWTKRELLTDMNKLNTAIAILIRKPEYDSIGQELIATYEAGDYDKYNRMMLDLVPDVEYHTDYDVSREMSPERIQTYLREGGAPWLDDTYTVFGQVVEGLDVIDRIAAMPTGPNDMALNRIYMRVSVEEVPVKEIEETYGYTYDE